MTIERLESRIAPASFSGKVLTYTDVDGDFVTITFKSKGKLDSVYFEFDGAFDAEGPQKLNLIDLTARRAPQGVSLTMSVEQAAGGDGRADVGFLNAEGIDLRNVKLMGDIAKLEAGNKDCLPGIKRLEVYSIGVQPPPYPDSYKPTGVDLEGGVNKLIVTTDVHTEIDISGIYPKVKLLDIGGSLVGGDDRYSGYIDTNETFGEVKIGGSILGGSGQSSGILRALWGVTKLTIGGSVIGGAGEYSGVVSIEGPYNKTLGQLSILGDVIGGEGDFSGRVDSRGAAGSISIGGDLRGGAGSSSGDITVEGPLEKMVVNGSIIGGSSAGSGIFRAYQVHSMTIGGDIRGGAGDVSGGAVVFKLRSGTIAGSLIGGSGDLGGFVYSDVLKDLTIGGNLVSGDSDFGASIVARVRFGSLTVEGDIIGNETNHVRILAGGLPVPPVVPSKARTIESIQINGSATFTEILAGYIVGFASTLQPSSEAEPAPGSDQTDIFLMDYNPDVQIGRISVLGDWTAGSIVAGIADFRRDGFGNADDAQISYESASILSSIASIQIGGAVHGTAREGDHYGFTAEWIEHVQVGGQDVPLNLGAGNDRYPPPVLAATSDVTVLEVPPWRFH